MQFAELTTKYVFEPLLTLSEAAEILGIHQDTLKKRARAGEIPAMKIGKYWRLRLSDLDAWVQSKLVSPQPKLRRVN